MRQFLLIWLAVMIIDNLLPFLLGMYYAGNDHNRMALSVLGCKQSPVKWYYNIWCILSGLVFIIGGYITHSFFATGVSVAVWVLLALYGLGCEILSGLFPLNENREDQDLSSKIHGLGSALGFTALLFCPLLLGIASLMTGFFIWGMIGILSFVVALTFFVFFILGEKEALSQTVLQYGGLWQRLILVFCYIPFFLLVMGKLLYVF